MLMKKLNHTGDTIVEVLLSLGVLGMVIVGAYTIASRSLRSAQRAQERTHATKLAEGQVDKLKYLSESADARDVISFSDIAGATQSAPKCLNRDKADGNYLKAGLVSGGKCVDGIFTYSVSHEDSNNLFTVKVTWALLGGGRQENVTIQYRVIQP
jgi:type II secretory pathway pseudopilin PulG